MNFKSSLAFGTVTLTALVCLVGCSKSSFSTPPQAASFQQTPTMNNQVDILIIDDDSSAMLPYRQQLSQQAAKIIQNLSQSGMDYHIAVTSSSFGGTYLGGTFIGSPSIVTSGINNPSSSLQSNINYDFLGSGLQQSLMSMETSLSSNYLNGPGSGFLRSGAMLAVIAVSSDDDYSSNTVQSYVNFLDQLKPPFPNGARSWVFNYVGSTVLNSACGNFVNIGNRYIQMAQASGGLVQSMCNADWGVVTNNLQVIISNLLTDYYLSSQPILSSVVVKVNGATVPQDSTNGWSYLTGTSSSGAQTYYIHFNGTSIPNLYSTVTVSFTPANAK